MIRIERDSACRKTNIWDTDGEIVAWADSNCHCDVNKKDKNGIHLLSIPNRVLRILVQELGREHLDALLKNGS